MRRIFCLLIAMFKTSLSADLEYRTNIILKVITEICWFSSHIITSEIFFRNVSNINNYSLSDMRIFLATLCIIDETQMFLFFANLHNFAEKIRTGDFDLILTKPIDAQFFVSFQRLSPVFLINAFLGMIYLIFNLSGYSQFSWIKVPFYLYTCVLGLVVFYCFSILLGTLNVFFSYSDSLLNLWYACYKLATRPDKIYHRMLRMIILSVFPLAFMFSVPSRIFTEDLSYALLGQATLVTGVFFIITRLTWKAALKRYSSASS